MGSSVKNKNKIKKGKQKKSEDKNLYPGDKNPFDQQKKKKKGKKIKVFKAKKTTLKSEESYNGELNPLGTYDNEKSRIIRDKSNDRNVKQHNKTIESPTINKPSDNNGNSDLTNQKKSTNYDNTKEIAIPSTTSSNSNKLTIPIDDDEKTQSLRMYRTSSVSKRKNKKLRIKKIAKRLKTGNNEKKKNKAAELQESEATKVVVRRPTVNKRQEVTPAASLRTLQLQAEEVTDVARNSLMVIEEKRQNELEQMLLKTQALEEASYNFAVVSEANHLKQKSQTTCCGFGSKWKICWYICACTTGVKKKKKYKQGAKKDKNNGNDDEEAYKLIENFAIKKPANNKVQELKSSQTVFAPMKPSPDSSAHGSKISLNSLSDSKLGKLKQGLRSSMPQIDRVMKTPTFGLEKRGRKYSSTSAIDKPLTEKQMRKKKEQSEQSINDYVQQFEDDEQRKRAASLLRLDH